MGWAVCAPFHCEIMMEHSNTPILMPGVGDISAGQPASSDEVRTLPDSRSLSKAFFVECFFAPSITIRACAVIAVSGSGDTLVVAKGQKLETSPALKRVLYSALYGND